MIESKLSKQNIWLSIGCIITRHISNRYWLQWWTAMLYLHSRSPFDTHYSPSGALWARGLNSPLGRVAPHHRRGSSRLFCCVLIRSAHCLLHQPPAVCLVTSLQLGEEKTCPAEAQTHLLCVREWVRGLSFTDFNVIHTLCLRIHTESRTRLFLLLDFASGGHVRIAGSIEAITFAKAILGL